MFRISGIVQVKLATREARFISANIQLKNRFFLLNLDTLTKK